MLNSSNNSSYDEKRKKYTKEVKLYTDKGIKSFVFKILGKGNKLVTPNDIIRSDAEHENEIRKTGKLDNLVFNSSLVFKEYPIGEDDGGVYDFITEISGIIDGKNVVIKYSKKHSSYSGTIEGLTIGEEDAKSVFDKFKDIALERSGRIKGIYDDIYAVENEIKKIDEEKIKEKLQLQTKTYVNDILSI